MLTNNLNDLYQRVINSNSRLQRLAVMQAPDIIVRNENRVMRQAVHDLLNNEEITQTISQIGTDAFITYFNHIAGTEISFPIGTADRALQAA